MANGKGPGPGAYAVGAMGKSPAFSVSKSGRDDIGAKGKQPGPGQYKIKSSFGT